MIPIKLRARNLSLKKTNASQLLFRGLCFREVQRHFFWKKNNKEEEEEKEVTPVEKDLPKSLSAAKTRWKCDIQKIKSQFQ